METVIEGLVGQIEELQSQAVATPQRRSRDATPKEGDKAADNTMRIEDNKFSRQQTTSNSLKGQYKSSLENDDQR